MIVNKKEELTEELLEKVLGKKVASFKLNPISPKLHVMECLFLDITFQNKESKRYVLKLHSPIAGYQQFAKMLGLCQRESNFYEWISKQKEDLSFTNLKIPQSFFSKVDDLKCMIILEDLKKLGYSDFDGGLTEGCNLEEGKEIVVALSELHQLFSKSDLEKLDVFSINSERYQKLFVEPIEKMKELFLKFREKMILENFENGEKIIEFIKKNISKVKVKEFLDDCSKDGKMMYHGDYKMENLMINKEKKKIGVLDYQTLCKCGILGVIIDLSSFITNNFKVEERKKNENDLIKIYYDNTKDIFGYSFQKFLEIYKSSIFWQLVLQCFTSKHFLKEQSKEAITRQNTVSRRVLSMVSDHLI